MRRLILGLLMLVGVLGATATSEIKGRDLFSGVMAEAFAPR